MVAKRKHFDANRENVIFVSVTAFMSKVVITNIGFLRKAENLCRLTHIYI